jgi:hypothetical protein
MHPTLKSILKLLALAAVVWWICKVPKSYSYGSGGPDHSDDAAAAHGR